MVSATLHVMYIRKMSNNTRTCTRKRDTVVQDKKSLYSQLRWRNKDHLTPENVDFISAASSLKYEPFSLPSEITLTPRAGQERS